MLKLILCEVLTMFQVLRTGGCFVVKSFETHLAATNALLGVLHDNFECFTIVKPVTRCSSRC
jgi:23S rRNA U2552 (ribose-2'-O)-methylase RlmE/FtsJ